ncbi:MAG: stage III sporulation protein AD [Clostridia bacterium]|nr:stage III sporulation protein AD [Clostridia bacterium]MBQ6530791.1 stage III sporulation protein AD [Clostridia bacterium]MBR0088280.1 stage III sporulation protein AD [Clostridia bacterium]
MDIFKIIGVGLVGGVLTVTVRRYKSEYGIIVGLITIMVILFFVMDALGETLNEIRFLTERSGVDARYITAVIKVVGIAYVTEFAAEILRDGGEGAIASKVEMAGKVFILWLTVPIVREFLEVCINALSHI